MKKALQDCCRSMRIGKILIDSDSDTETAHVVFAKFMEDIADRKVDKNSTQIKESQNLKLRLLSNV